MKTNNIAFMATEYLFHLNNANDENGIMPTENWKLEKVSLAQKLVIEHDYYPTVSVAVDHKSMDDFADAVLKRIHTKYPKIHIKDQLMETHIGADHFIAYSPSRMRRQFAVQVLEMPFVNRNKGHFALTKLLGS